MAYLLKKDSVEISMYCIKVCFLFLGNRGKDDEYTEMNQQQLQFAKMSKEFYEKEEDEDDDTTFEMFLKYCPDALSHLFDKCIMKPVEEQVQGDATQYCPFLRAIAMKLITSDPMLVKQKCI